MGNTECLIWHLASHTSYMVCSSTAGSRCLVSSTARAWWQHGTQSMLFVLVRSAALGP